VEFAEGGEELVGEAFVKSKLRRELDEEWAKFIVEAANFVEESLKEGAGVDELGFVGDGFGNLNAEAEVVGGGGGPALPGLEPVGAVEAGVDFDAGKALGTALEMGACGGEKRGVLLGECPAGGADADVRRRVR